MNVSIPRLIGVTALLSIMTACASVDLRPERVAEAESAIRMADAAQAEAIPQAALHLQLARNDFNMAKRFAAKGNETRGELFLSRAIADADLALALAKENDAKSKAAEANKDVKDLEGKVQ